MRQDDLRRAGRVVAKVADVAAREVQEALHQGEGFVQHARRAPAVGAGEDALRAVAGVDAAQLLFDDVVGALPADGDKGVVAAFAVGLGDVVKAIEESFTDHRLCDADFVIDLVGDDGLQRVVAEVFDGGRG